MAKHRVIPIESMTPETKCGYCTNSKCCTYITQQIETPRSKRDFDFLLWQISHRDIRIYKDEGSWYMLVENVCGHLQHDGRCGIYDDRPAGPHCDEHRFVTNDGRIATGIDAHGRARFTAAVTTADDSR